MDDQIDSKPKKSWTHNADNRARLIAAGRAILSEKGIDATTVKEIARYANVSPGLFHYYFASKDELLLAVVYEAGGQFNRELMGDLELAMASSDFSAVALLTAHEVGHKDPAWYRLRYELYALGLRNPKILPALGTYLAKIREEMAKTIVRLTGMSAESAAKVAIVMLACVDGMALQKIAQPDLDLVPAYELVQHLVRSA
jgi:AcrR family transcriptional regulator